MPKFNINIVRVTETETATMGECYVNGILIGFTLELPWKENIILESNIPEGKYAAMLRYDKSRDGFFTVELIGTGPRTGIQIHVGNKPDDVSGCILLGTSAKYQEALVGGSTKAIAKLRSLFYGSTEPTICPDLEISVTISALISPIRFYPSTSERSFWWQYDAGYWYPTGGTSKARFKELVRNTEWIISQSETAGVLEKKYARWGLQGRTPFQVSDDLKNWVTLSADELLVREPRVSVGLWHQLAKAGSSVDKYFSLAMDVNSTAEHTTALHKLAERDFTHVDKIFIAVPMEAQPVDIEREREQDRHEGAEAHDYQRDEDDGARDGIYRLEFDQDVIELEPDTESDQSDYESDFERDTEREDTRDSDD